MKMDQTIRQIREMMSVAEALNQREAQAHYEKLDPLWTRLRTESKQYMKAKEDKLHADWAKFDAEKEK
jgi:muramidase (phage lysozyme)